MILVRYVLREHFAPFVSALSVITFLFVIDFFVNLLDSVLSKGLPLGIVLEIFVLNLAWMLALAIPMAVLVSCLMAFGRLSADHEITAVKAAGHPPFLLMRPVLLVGALMMLLLIIFNNWILPEANHRAAALMSAVSRKKPSAFIDAGRLITQFPGVQIWVNRIDPLSGTLHGVTIFETEERGTPRLMVADSATIEYLDMGATILLKLRDGENHIVDDDPAEYFRIRFLNQDFAIRNVDDRLERRERNHRGDREMPVEMMLEVVDAARANYAKLTVDHSKDLWSEIDLLLQLMPGDTVAPLLPEHTGGLRVRDSLSWRITLLQVQARERGHLRLVDRAVSRLQMEEKRVAQYRVEIHKKFSIPVAILVFVLIGAPLGIMARRGGIGTGVVYSIFFFILYWVFLIGGENLADRLLVRPEVAMWTPNAIIGVGGIWITWRMTRDNQSGNGLVTRVKAWFAKRKQKP